MNERRTLEELQVDFINLGWNGDKPATLLDSVRIFNKMHNELALALKNTDRAERITRILIEQARQGGYDQQWVANELAFEINVIVSPEDRKQLANEFLKTTQGTNWDLDLYLQRVNRLMDTSSYTD